MSRTYYLTTSGTLQRRDQTLVFTPKYNPDLGGAPPKPRRIPVQGVSDLFGMAQLDINSSALNFLGQNGIHLHLFDYYGNYTGSFAPKEYLLAGEVQLLQTQAYLSEQSRLELAKSIVAGALENIRKNLMYYSNRRNLPKDVTQKLKEFTEYSGTATDISSLMGHEGNARVYYYQQWDQILTGDLKFEYRSRRPPHNGLNAIISFLNGMCYAECLRAIYHTQLNPTISFLHEPGYRRYSLALDLAEIFKPLLADRLIFTLINRNQLNANSFEAESGGVMLKENARKTILRAWDERLETTLKHRSLNRKVSYRHLIRLEAYKLTKHLLGVTPYAPFAIWW